MLPPTVRFSNRVADYVRYRPGYPGELVSALESMIGLRPEWRVADIGSGTGKLTELFLEYGCEVTAIEPNLEMREAGEQALSSYPNFKSEGTAAEKTGLADNSVDLITAGQAFHWFDPEEAKKEFNRILGPEGWVALIWNDRRVTGTPFLDAYEQLLRTQPEYLAIGHKTEAELMHSGFFDGEPLFWSIPSYQEFDWEGLLGRARSSSYVPSPEQVEHSSFINRLRAVFDETQVGGKVAFEYETQMFVGKV